MGRGVAALGLIAVVGCSNSSDPARFDAQASPGPIDASSGYAVVAATAYTPDPAGQAGSVPVTDTGDGAYQLTVTVDQFAMIALDLAPLGELCPPD